MSKKRPSPSYGNLARQARPTATKAAPGYWRSRVFRNTYTYNGRLVEVRKWSVKLQYRGKRRTFSLWSSRRAEAASEACRLYARLLREGWDQVRAWHGSGAPAVRAEPSAQGRHPWTALTRRERQVLALVSQARPDKEIAHALAISIHTVHDHIRNIFGKLGVHNRTGAAITVLRK